MGSTERREREREEIRARILDAARELFISEGYDAVTMRKIAQRIEYTPTAIYFHFKDKAALLRELCGVVFLALLKKLLGLAKVNDLLEKLQRLGQAYIEFALEHPNHYRLMFMTPMPPVPPEDQVLQHGNPDQDAYAFLLAHVKLALEAGCFRAELTDAHLIAQILWSGTHGIASLEIAKKGDAWVEWRPVKKRARLMIEVLVRGLAKEKD
jgi:AcrR family transcriptional regulator